MSHSKRNTSRPVFTSHERALAKSNWTSSSARLSRDSFLPFGSCGLCLNIARDPVACKQGDVFCRECALANLLAQKKDIKRANKARQHAEGELAKLKALDDEEDRLRAVRDFELTQAGLDRAAKSKARQSNKEDAKEEGESTTAIVVATAGTRRKFSLDEEELDRISKVDRAKARKAIDDEKAAKPTLPSFWTPSLTPDVTKDGIPAVVKKEKAVPTCPISKKDDPHSFSMQNLIPINFREDEDAKSSTKEKQRVCPSCLKVLSNASNPMLAKQCGHVLCHSCVKQFMMPSNKKTSLEAEQVPITCYVCDTPISSKPSKKEGASADAIPGMVSLRSEGTGFSARGTSTVEKSTVAFQC